MLLLISVLCVAYVLSFKDFNNLKSNKIDYQTLSVHNDEHTVIHDNESQSNKTSNLIGDLF